MRVLIYDGTSDGFYTAVFDGWREECAIFDDERNLRLGDEGAYVQTDEEKAARVAKKLRSISPLQEKNIRLVLRCDIADKAQVAHEYLRLVLSCGANACERLSDGRVRKFFDYLKKIKVEEEHLLGFLRFNECADGILYAPCSPDHDILELLLPHFIDRLHGQKFVIHDVGRKKAALYNGERTLIVPLDRAEITLSESEENFLALWRKYYDAVTIQDRKNLAQMKRSMPVRYWKFMSEKTR
jgi:probable DNA metabolism protein